MSPTQIPAEAKRGARASTRVVVFGFDANESSQIRRIRSLIDIGYDVVAFTMRRENMNAEFVPPWRNIHLAVVPNEKLFQRLGILLLSLFKIANYRREIVEADLIIARNFDQLLLAAAARLIAFRPRLPLAYECLDVHGSFTATSVKGRAFRALERVLLKRVTAIIVSSSGFIDNYFTPIQHYSGRVSVLENKIWFGDLPAERTGPPTPVAAGRPWVLGWVGTLRCQPSLEILLETAERMGDRVRIEMYGIVHAHVLPDFAERIARHPNITFHGPYRYPDDLGDVYRACDFVWAQDLWQRGANSDWLLPNRIYEASYFGCLSIAVAGTETARKVRNDDLGFVIAEPTAGALVELLDSLQVGLITEARTRLLAQDRMRFVYSPDELDAVVQSAIA